MGYLGVIALATIIGFSFTACANIFGIGSGLVLGAGYAWVYSIDGQDVVAVIFNSDNTYQTHTSNSNIWSLMADGNYAVYGNNLSYNDGKGTVTATFSINGDTLTLTREGANVTYTKKKFIPPGK